MRKNKLNLLIFAVTGLMIIGFSAKCFAYPIPTVDVKRIGSTMKTVKNQVEIVKREVEFNINLVKQIQNGGYAAAGMALVGHMDVYSNYGNMTENIGQNLQDSATQTQASFAKQEKREKMLKQLSERQAALAAEEREKNASLAAATTDKLHDQYKKETFKKKFKQWAPIVARAGESTESLIKDGDFSEEGIGRTIDNSRIISVGEDVVKNVKNNSQAGEKELNGGQ